MNDVIMKYSNEINPEINIKTIDKWIENEKVKVIYVNKHGKEIETERRIYFDSHDLYLIINSTRYYYNEFDVLE